jgi:hypothetical protein
MHSERYSPDLERRYQAAISEQGTTLPEKWPVACGGAANAFLVLLGPSMGAPRRDEVVELGGANRPQHHPMQIGQAVMDFEGLGHRKPRWWRLCAAILGGGHYITSMTALLNLDSRHSSSESGIPATDLIADFRDYIWPLLNQLRPRIVCVLSNRTWDTIYPQISQHQGAPLKLPLSLTDSRGIKPSRQPLVFQFPGCDFQTLLIKPHRIQRSGKWLTVFHTEAKAQ